MAEHTPPVKIEEHPNTADKSEPENVSCTVSGKDGRGHTTVEDSTPGNEHYEKSVGPTRMRMGHDGKLLIKGSSELQIIGGNVIIYGNSSSQLYDGALTIHCDTFYIKASKVVIDGDLEVKGKIDAVGDIKTDVTGITLATHVHKQPNVKPDELTKVGE